MQISSLMLSEAVVAAPDVIIQGEPAEAKYSLVLMIAIYQDLVLLVQTEQKTELVINH